MLRELWLVERFRLTHTAFGAEVMVQHILLQDAASTAQSAQAPAITQSIFPGAQMRSAPSVLRAQRSFTREH
jgi:cyclopropane fatty-acyl-phospholipid synthase-like methyltransferase